MAVILNRYSFNGLNVELCWYGDCYGAEVHYPDGTLDDLGEFDSKAEVMEEILRYAETDSREEVEPEEENEPCNYEEDWRDYHMPEVDRSVLR